MSATPMRGKPLAERIQAEVAEEVKAIGRIGLVTVLVGDDPASDVYIRLKHKAATEAGFDGDRPAPARRRRARKSCSQSSPSSTPTTTSTRSSSSCRCRTHIDEARIIRAVDPAKDVDGFHPSNAGELYLGRPALVPATPRGVMALLAEHTIELDGARAVVIGRSAIVGKPVAHAPAAGERDRHDLPLPHPTSRGTPATPTCSSPRSASRRSSRPTW